MDGIWYESHQSGFNTLSKWKHQALSSANTDNNRHQHFIPSLAVQTFRDGSKDWYHNEAGVICPWNQDFLLQ